MVEKNILLKNYSGGCIFLIKGVFSTPGLQKAVPKLFELPILWELFLFLSTVI